MTDPLLAAARPDGPPQELINRLNETAAFHRPERLDADDAPEYTWREIREITDLLSEAAAALSASRTAQDGPQEDLIRRLEARAMIEAPDKDADADDMEYPAEITWGEMAEIAALLREAAGALRTDPAAPPQQDALIALEAIIGEASAYSEGHEHSEALFRIQGLAQAAIRRLALPSSPAEGHENK